MEYIFEKVNGNYYFMVVFRKSENTWKLGKQFFQKYQLVFNQDAKQIGVYTEIESSFEIAIFLIVIVSIIIVISLHLAYMMGKLSRILIMILMLRYFLMILIWF